MRPHLDELFALTPALSPREREKESAAIPRTKVSVVATALAQFSLKIFVTN
jgi:hypothetical protein